MLPFIFKAEGEGGIFFHLGLYRSTYPHRIAVLVPPRKVVETVTPLGSRHYVKLTISKLVISGHFAYSPPYNI